MGDRPGRGRLRLYLGAAPGVGKTYAMLAEAHRRIERGTDVVVGYVETHGRTHTAALLDGLEVLPRRTVRHRGADFTELDVDAVLARRPRVVLVDELAHSVVPAGKRWQDVETVLAAGIDVVSTVNVQHLESLNDVVREITGVPQRETVPDEVVRRAEQIELVDMTAEALRRRMAHGNIYPPEKVDAALANYFRVGNLTALRELALVWLAGKVDAQLTDYRAEHGIGGTWEARERVVVALTGGPEGDTLIRRAARIAARSAGAELLAVHVSSADGLGGAGPADLARQRTVVESLGGTYHQVRGESIPTALLDFARGVNATQLVLGVSRRSRLAQLLTPGVGPTTAARSGPIDVHLVTHERASRVTLRAARGSALSLRRRLVGFALAALGLPLLTWLLTLPAPSLSSDILLFLAAVVGVALVGGVWPALTAAVGGFLLLNYYFTAPTHRLTVADRDNLLALAVYVLVAAAVSAVVDLAARRTRDAARATADAGVLSTLAGSVLRGERTILERLRETYGLTSAVLLEHGRAVGSAGDTGSGPADADIPVDDAFTLALRGRTLDPADRRIAAAFGAQAALALRQQRLADRAASVPPLEAADRLRTALLSAVSHDLRTPLASAKAAVDSLTGDQPWSPADRAELLATAAESLDRLDRLVTNLLDLSRLQAGVLGVATLPLPVADAVATALATLAPTPVDVRVPDDIPDVLADPALLERVLANVIANAVRHNPPGAPVLITASALHRTVQVRVVDRGPGIPEADRDRVFLPFQRLGDRDNHTGVGLGLALARGFTEAMNGTLEPDDTPGGGLTMTLTLPAAAPHPAG
jgi:two-component system, OmpR family, sensor histidine kinase KdpD